VEQIKITLKLALFFASMANVNLFYFNDIINTENLIEYLIV